jgi:hypothetical protein
LGKDFFRCGRLVLQAITALLIHPYSFDSKETFTSVNVESQDEAIILKDACEFAHRIGADGTIVHEISSDTEETSDID